MRSVLMISTALLILAASGCAKQPATMPASASAPAPGSSAGATGAARPMASQSGMGAGAGLASTAPARTDSAGRVSPREFGENSALRDINFDFDKYDIRPADTKTLDANASWLKANPRALLLIEGHCDERGTPEYNLALGERRAKAAMSYLTALGIQANRISIISYGLERPLCRERGEACWAKNRRDHFLVRTE
jgi:peptidoglycan-associated lipoprotein